MAMTKEQLLEARTRLFEHENVKTVADLMATERWKKLEAENGGDKRATMEAMLTDKEYQDATCFFVSNDEYVEWKDGEDGKRERVVADQGFVVLMEDGELRTFWKQSEALDVPALTPMKVGPLQRNLNFRKGTTGKWKPFDDTKVELLPEDAEVTPTIPDLPLGTTFDELRKRHKGFGTIFGETADWQTPTALLYVMTHDRAVYHQGSEGDKDPRLNVLAIDSTAKAELEENPDLLGDQEWLDRNVVRVDIDPHTTYDLFGLDEDGEREEFHDALAGERILVHGQASIMRRRTRAYYENAGKADDYDEFITQAEDFMDEAKNGLKRLNLTKAEKQTGEDFADGIDFLEDKVVDIREEKDGSVVIYVASSQSIDTTVRTFEIKNGPNAGGSFVKNEGAFCVFVDYIGSEGAGLSEDDLDMLLGDEAATVTA